MADKKQDAEKEKKKKGLTDEQEQAIVDLIFDYKNFWVGIAAVILGLFLAFGSVKGLIGYATATERFTVDVHLISSKKSTYYDSSKSIDSHNAPYVATWQYTLEGETYTFETKEEYQHPADRKGVFYRDSKGEIHQFSTGKTGGGDIISTLKLIAIPIIVFAGGIVLIQTDLPKMKKRFGKKNKAAPEVKADGKKKRSKMR